MTTTTELPQIGDLVRIPGRERALTVRAVGVRTEGYVLEVSTCEYPGVWDTQWQPLPPLTPEEVRSLPAGSEVVCDGVVTRLDRPWLWPDDVPVALWERAPEPAAKPVCEVCGEHAVMKAGEYDLCGEHGKVEPEPDPVVVAALAEITDEPEPEPGAAMTQSSCPDREPQPGARLTVDQLEALPAGSIVRDRDGDTHTRHADGWKYDAGPALIWPAHYLHSLSPTLVRRGPEPKDPLTQCPHPTCAMAPGHSGRHMSWEDFEREARERATVRIDDVDDTTMLIEGDTFRLSGPTGVIFEAYVDAARELFDRGLDHIEGPPPEPPKPGPGIVSEHGGMITISCTTHTQSSNAIRVRRGTGKRPTVLLQGLHDGVPRHALFIDRVEVLDALIGYLAAQRAHLVEGGAS